ncbi:MAG: M48 family metalloprotease [Alphaproteobacteria bacterium]|nr:M48 family metalloprotease [Alphaproteobacteria bacterium]MDE2513557.1 M48 family metalloprotease [Alphaproteobacteria bacterium]
MKTVLKIICLLLATNAVLVRQAVADGDSPNLIRDVEIETMLRTFEMPVWRAAGLDPNAMHFYIVQDPQLNSFVAGGQNIFMNTGTILRADRPNELVGIMAHETGHIAGGHLARFATEMHDATIKAIIAMAVGAAASVVGHDYRGIGGAMAGGEGVGERSFLSFSVAQEGAADHAAIKFLDATHQSSKGLLDFFKILEPEELLSPAQQDPYMRTHPLTTERIAYIEQHVAQSPYTNNPDPPQWIPMLADVKAKLRGFLDPPEKTLEKYPTTDQSVPARYARAVAYYRIPEVDKALAEIDSLLHEQPDNPYFWELKGQILFDNGRVAKAIGPYQRAVALNNAPLMRVELAQVELETQDPALLPKALAQLSDAVNFERDNPEAWRQLAIAYGRSNNEGMAALSLAEKGMADGDYKTAIQQSQRARQILPAGPQRQRAEDIEAEAKRIRDAS